MGKVYYSQIDSRWKNHPYPADAAGYRDKTVGTSGCGPTCAAMVVSSSKEVIRPDTMCDLSREQGFRVAGGTSDALFPFVAQKWGLEYKRLSSSYEAHDYCKKGWFVVICCRAGLWTTGGHFILAVGATDSEIEIYDPYLYSGKFNRNGRRGLVNLVGNSAWVNIDKFKANSNAQRFFAFNVGAGKAENTDTKTETKIKYVGTNASALNVRKGPGTNYGIVGCLKKGTQVIVYEESNGWSRIGDNKWCSSKYLSDSKPVTSKTMYVNTSSAPLNVRKTAGGKVISQVTKGTAVTVVAEQNGWSQITSPTSGWVSSSYLSSTKPSTGSNRHTVGQTKIFKGTTYLFSRKDLTGTKYTYKPKTAVKILENTSSHVDKIYVKATGRVAYVNINAYK